MTSKRLVPWGAFLFGAALSSLAVVGPFVSLAIGVPASWWEPVVIAFLPMCFYFVGAALARLQTEVDELKTVLASRKAGEELSPHVVAVEGESKGLQGQYSLRHLLLALGMIAIGCNSPAAGSNSLKTKRMRMGC